MYRQPMNTILNRPRTIVTGTFRCVSSCIHIKGLPVALPNSNIYHFLRHYGEITEFATFKEAPRIDADADNSGQRLGSSKRYKNYINHDRPPGTTAVVSFSSASSAIMCKEVLHWRPFPIIDVDEKGNDIPRPLIEKDIVRRNARDRPILNILFETNHMRAKLRPFVKRNLVASKKLIKTWNNLGKQQFSNEMENI